jgi:hypothetical protein
MMDDIKIGEARLDHQHVSIIFQIELAFGARPILVRAPAARADEKKNVLVCPSWRFTTSSKKTAYMRTSSPTDMKYQEKIGF